MRSVIYLVPVRRPHRSEHVVALLRLCALVVLQAFVFAHLSAQRSLLAIFKASPTRNF